MGNAHIRKALIFLVALVTVTRLEAAAVSGRVFDSSGSVLPGVAVEATRWELAPPPRRN